MNPEQLLKILEDLGIKRLDAQVYLLLATEEPKKGREISNELRINKPQLYSILRKLQNKGLVTVSPEHPARFSAILFDKVLDLLITAKREQAKAIQASREELLSSWRKMVKDKPEKS